MYEVKLGTIIDTVAVAQKFLDRELPASYSRAFGRYFKIVFKENEEYLKIERKKYTQYGEKLLDANGNEQLKLKPENLEIYQEEMKELRDQLVQVELNKIPFDKKRLKTLDTRSYVLMEWIFEEDSGQDNFKEDE